MQSMIRKLRLERNMSQKQLAKVVGTSQQTISRIENDVMSSPVDLLVNIADYLMFRLIICLDAE